MEASSSIEKFLQTIPGTVKEIKTVDSVITQSGDFKSLYGIDSIMKSLMSLFTITKRSYFFDPDLGANIYRYIFEPVDVVTKSNIEQEIGIALTKYEDRADIRFNVQFFKNKKGFRINFTIDYSGEKRNLTIDIDESLLKTLQK